jgi:uncharacterized protein (TIGR03067 family)
MRVFLAMILALGLVFGFGQLGLADDKPIEQELQRDQGTWQFEALTIDGRPVAKGMLKDWRLIIKGNDWTFRQGEKTVLQGKYQIVAVEGKVRQTIVTVLEGNTEKHRLLGITEVQGKMRKGCLAKPGQDRPTTFSSEPGSGQILIIYKRVSHRTKL